MQPKVQAENFMRGAFLITLAQLITKVIGAIHRPASQIFIGDAGLTLATPPSTAYYIILAISSVGLNVAISRLVSERLALEDYLGARRVFRVATGMLLVSGLVFSLLFALGAGWMARVQGFPDARPGFLVLAPALFLVALLCTFRGLYQGMQQMRYSAMSQVVEQIGRVIISLALMAVVAPIALNFGAAAFNAGNTIGILIAVLYFAWIYFRERPTAGWNSVAPGVESLAHESTPAVMGKILSIAVPLSLIGAVAPLMAQIDSAIVTNRLLATGAAEGVADKALAWLGNAGTLRDLPSILTTALYISLVPAVTESVARGRLVQARYRAATAFRVTFLIAIPATVGLLVGAREAYGVLYTGPGYVVMAPMAWSTIALMVQQTASGTLQGMGHIWLTVRNLLAGVIVKALLTYWWTGLPWLGARGAAYATGVGFGVAAALNLIALRRHLRLGINLKDDVGRPLLASLAMGAAIWLVSPVVHQVLPAGRLAGLLVIGAGGVVYLLAVLLLGGVTEADTGLIPGLTPRMLTFLKRYRLLRVSSEGVGES